MRAGSRAELVVLARDAQALPLMPNRVRYVVVYLCAGLYVANDYGDPSVLPFRCIAGAPNAESALVSNCGSGIGTDAQIIHVGMTVTEDATDFPRLAADALLQLA
jgi:hypothetical protein